jgi:hypothetical protein
MGPRSVLTAPDANDPHRTSSELLHSITSSARASSIGGTARPSVLAVSALMTSSNLDGNCTNRQVRRLGALDATGCCGGASQNVTPNFNVA